MKTRFLTASLTFCLTTSLLAQWNSDPMQNLGIAVKPDEQVQPKIRPTAEGGGYISWFDNDPTGGIRLAHLGMSSTQDYGLDVGADANALLFFLDDRRRHNPNVIVT